jgi:hypothetical protein
MKKIIKLTQQDIEQAIIDYVSKFEKQNIKGKVELIRYIDPNFKTEAEVEIIDKL